MAVAKSGKMNFGFHVFILLIRFGWGRVHDIQLQDEVRQTIELSKFGFLQDGILSVNFFDMVIKDDLQSKDVLFGFTLEKTGSDGISPYMEQHSEKCILKDPSQLTSNGNQISLAIIKFDLTKNHIQINKFGSDFLNLTFQDKSTLYTTVTTTSITKETLLVSPDAKQSTSEAPPSNQASSTISVPKNSTTTASLEGNLDPRVGQDVSTTSVPKNNSSSPSPQESTIPISQTASVTTVPKHNKAYFTAKNSTSWSRRRKRRDAETTQATLAESEMETLPLYKSNKTVNISDKYSGNFVVQVRRKEEEGLYNLYFHNCPVSNKNNINNNKRVPVALQIHIVEKNGNNYLSAGEEPLPYMFGVLSVLFFGTTIYWLHVLRKDREFTYKVHYMMFVLIFLKSLDLMLQAVNYHFISKDGKPAESLEVLYYITHLLKGALLFTTIVLIGTGYFFIKHVLSDRDKKIFMIVIPLQILANTAQIVMESTEEANTQYTTWKELFILVDLLCCGAILFPVVWSIRHLQDASQTDGKAALNLAKLKLFRHFYVMIVCYIYFTRIIVYLIKITVPFQYMWLDDFFNNAASYVFFVLTGYKFRPAPDNPYLHVPQGDSDEEVEMEEVVTNAGLADGVTRLQPSSNGKRIFETA